MIAAYLYLNAVLYFILAVWCVVLPEKTATALGFQLLNGSGKSEYFVIYGGLQLGLALFFAYCAYLPENQAMGLKFSLFLYVPIFTCRLISFLRFQEIGFTTIATAGLEAVLTAAVLYLYFRN